MLDRCRATLTNYQAGPLANYVPYTPNTARILDGLASLNPRTLAIMHGSSFSGDCAGALRDLSAVMKDVLASPSYQFGV